MSVGCFPQIPYAQTHTFLATLWAFGLTILLRTAYDAAVPLPLRDIGEQTRLALSLVVFITLATVAALFLEQSSPELLYQPTRAAHLIRLCAARSAHTVSKTLGGPPNTQSKSLLLISSEKNAFLPTDPQ